MGDGAKRTRGLAVMGSFRVGRGVADSPFDRPLRLGFRGTAFVSLQSLNGLAHLSSFVVLMEAIFLTFLNLTYLSDVGHPVSKIWRLSISGCRKSDQFSDGKSERNIILRDDPKLVSRIINLRTLSIIHVADYTSS